MFRISKRSLITKTDLELFGTVENRNDHIIKAVNIINRTIFRSSIMVKLRRDSVDEEPKKYIGNARSNKQTNSLQIILSI